MQDLISLLRGMARERAIGELNALLITVIYDDSYNEEEKSDWEKRVNNIIEQINENLI